MEAPSRVITSKFSELLTLELALAPITSAGGPHASGDSLASSIRMALDSALAAGKRTPKDAQTALAEAWATCVSNMWAAVATSAKELSPATLESSSSFGVLDSLRGRLLSIPGAASALKAHNALVLAAASVWGANKPALTPERETRTIGLLNWWGDDVCEKRWGVLDAWTGASSHGGSELMSVACVHGTPALIDFLVSSKGVTVNGNFAKPADEAPLYLAFDSRKEANFDKLLKLGADVTTRYADGYPLAVTLFDKGYFHDNSGAGARADSGSVSSVAEPELKAARSMQRTLLHERPQALESSCHSAGDEALGVLCAAIRSRDREAVTLAFEEGAKLRYAEEKVVLPDGLGFSLKPTLLTALAAPSYDVLEYLIREQGIATSWRAKHGRKMWNAVADSVAAIAVCGYPRNPAYVGPKLLFDFNPDFRKLLDLLISVDLMHSTGWLGGRTNSLNRRLFSNDQSCAVSDAHALELLTKYVNHKRTVTYTVDLDGTDDTDEPDEIEVDEGEWGTNLAHYAARAGMPGVLKFAINRCGCHVDGLTSSAHGLSSPLLVNVDYEPATPLIVALIHGKVEVALALLQQHNASASYEELPVHCQPVSLVLSPTGRYDDKTALSLIKAVARNDPSFLCSEYFVEPASLESATFNPLHLCAAAKPECLEFLLSSMEGALDLAKKAVPSPPVHNRSGVYARDALTMALEENKLDSVKACLRPGRLQWRFRHETQEVAGVQCMLFPHLLDWMLEPTYDVMRYLFDEGHVTKDCMLKQDERFHCDIATRLADFAVRVFSSAVGVPSGLETLELAMKAGLGAWRWDAEGFHALHMAIDRNESTFSCAMTEDDILKLLKFYRSAGVDITQLADKDVVPQEAHYNLAYWAALNGYREVLRFAFEECGCDVDAILDHERKKTVLITALHKKRIGASHDLLTVHAAKSSYPDWPASSQPISQLLFPTDRYTDEEALELIKSLHRRERSFLAVNCFLRPSSVDEATWNPLLTCVPDKPKCFKYIVENVREAKALALLPTSTSGVTVGHFCCASRAWALLSSLLDHTEIRVTDGTRPIYQLVHERGPRPAPRALQARVKAKANAEKAQDKNASKQAAAEPSEASALAENTAAEPASAASSGANNAFLSNDFIDPFSRVISETEVQQREKKKAAKKKAKAKAKKKAAQAGAGAGASAQQEEPGTSSSDNSFSTEGEPHEEPDDNLVDSRYAPSVDVMFAAMGLGPGGAPLETATAAEDAQKEVSAAAPAPPPPPAVTQTAAPATQVSKLDAIAVGAKSKTKKKGKR